VQDVSKGSCSKTASHALNNTGGIGVAFNALNSHAQRIEARRAEQQNIAMESQQTVQQCSASVSSNSFGIDSYQHMFSL
jgi:hypothetical protein